MENFRIEDISKLAATLNQPVILQRIFREICPDFKIFKDLVFHQYGAHVVETVVQYAREMDDETVEKVNLSPIRL